MICWAAPRHPDPIPVLQRMRCGLAPIPEANNTKRFRMRIQQSSAWLALFCCAFCASVAASSGPDDRRITDPKSVVSASNPAARPAPLDDLYYTRSVFGAAWSPDGQQIFSPATSQADPICGRCLPRVDGPSNLPSPTIGSTAPPGRPTAIGSSTSKTPPATSYGTSTPYPVKEASRSTSPIPPRSESRARTGLTTAKQLPLSIRQKRPPVMTLPSSTGAPARSRS
jgi:hypothetical protein